MLLQLLSTIKNILEEMTIKYIELSKTVHDMMQGA